MVGDVMGGTKIEHVCFNTKKQTVKQRLFQKGRGSKCTFSCKVVKG